MTDIQQLQHVIDVNGRLVHMRIRGKGPPVLLLHASPVSGAMFDDQLALFSERFTAIALDTPGYGLSDPLAIKEPTIADYADALADTLTAMGLKNVALYGRHTGASIAVEFGRRHPTRAAFVLVDGYPMFSPDAVQRYLSDYLVPYRPSSDGLHLAWWWWRFREQHVFWPWNMPCSANRATQDMPSLDYLQRGFVAILTAGRAYDVGYRAAFQHDSEAALRSLDVPACITARPTDSLFRGFAGVPDVHPKRQLPGDTSEAARVELEILLEAAEWPTAGSETRDASIGQLTRAGFTRTSPQLFFRTFGAISTQSDVIVALGPWPGGCEPYVTWLEAIGKNWPTIGFDLAGNGNSAPCDIQSLEAQTEWLATALDELSVNALAVLSIGGSAGVAARLAEYLSHLPLVMIDKDRETTPAPPDLTPEHSGAHTLRTWQYLRDQLLWTPGDLRMQAHAREICKSGLPNADWLDRVAIEYLKHCQTFRSSCLAASDASRSVIGRSWEEKSIYTTASLGSPPSSEIRPIDHLDGAKVADAVSAMLGKQGVRR